MKPDICGFYCVAIVFGSTFAPSTDAAEFFNIQGDPQNGYQWNQYATAQDMLSNTNKLAQGVSVWSKEEAFFAAPGEFYNIQGDPQNGYQWNQYATAQDMLSNTNKLAQGVSVWSKEEAFFAAAGGFFNIQGDPQNGYQWNQYATAQDMLSNANKLAQGVSVWSKEEAFFAVPEPSSIVLVCSGLGVVGLAVMRRRRGSSRAR